MLGFHPSPKLELRPSIAQRTRKLAVLAAALVLPACGGSAHDEERVDSSTAFQESCGEDANHFRYMDDACHRKIYPSNRARTLSCPVISTDSTGFSPASGPMQLDPTAFNGVLPNDPSKPTRVFGVIIRRIGGVPYYHYVSNGTENEPIQTWSASKFIAAMAAGETLRSRSSHTVGLTGTVDGWPIGDLITDIESYENRISSSNGLARYMKNVAQRDVANWMVTTWLGRGPGEEFRGGYGSDLAPLSYIFFAPDGGAAVRVTNDDRSGYTNLISTFTLGEMLKRLAVWDDPSTHVPNLEAEDVETMLYGAASSRAYPNEPGGMMRDAAAVYLQNGIDMRSVEANSKGRWRMFSKLGYGEATRPGLGYVAELVHVAYACLPVLDSAGAPVPNQGAEMVLAVHQTHPNGMRGDEELNDLYGRIMQRVMLPRAQPPGGVAIPAAP